MDFLSQVFTKGYIIVWVIMACVSFCQNMAFTLVSRSRNSADTKFHRKTAWFSNGVWLICQMFVWKQVWPILIQVQDLSHVTLVQWMQLIITILVYSFSTAEGSVLMMKIALKTEKGKRRVGTTLDKK